MKILVLEQDESLSETYREFFEECGHKCQTACDRKSAILHLRSQKYDTLLADLPIPDFDFGDLLDTLHDNLLNKQIRIFVVRPFEFSVNTYNILKQIGITGFFTKSLSKSLLNQIFSEEKKQLEIKNKADKKKNPPKGKSGTQVLL